MIFTVTNFRTLLNQAYLHPAEAFCMSALRQHVDRRLRISIARKCFEIHGLATFISEPSCSEDKLKLRWIRGFGKHAKPEFSTFCSFACGREWTTQRSIAFDTFARSTAAESRNQPVTIANSDFSKVTALGHCYARLAKPDSASALAGLGRHRSRCAKSRKRRAFNLMKPSASC